MNITFGKKDVLEAEFLNEMMEVHEEIIIWKIKKSKAANIINKDLCDLEID